MVKTARHAGKLGSAIRLWRYAAYAATGIDRLWPRRNFSGAGQQLEFHLRHYSRLEPAADKSIEPLCIYGSRVRCSARCRCAGAALRCLQTWPQLGKSEHAVE